MKDESLKRTNGAGYRDECGGQREKNDDTMKYCKKRARDEHRRKDIVRKTVVKNVSKERKEALKVKGRENAEQFLMGSFKNSSETG